MIEARNHTRKRLRDLIRDVERHLQDNGPWRYRLSHIYDAPEVLAEVQRLATAQDKKLAA
jgi:hypothetical protein